MIKETIVAYMLICGTGVIGLLSADSVTKKVNEKIKDGWKPFMAPYIQQDKNWDLQAVVKYQVIS